MKFTVVWKPTAADKLADLWTVGPDRAAITQAANLIDRLLQNDPLRQGEERGDDTRILIEAPLAVYYSVSQADCLVTVHAAWRWSAAP
jgi:hypothetical protein